MRYNALQESTKAMQDDMARVKAATLCTYYTYPTATLCTYPILTLRRAALLGPGRDTPNPDPIDDVALTWSTV